MTYLPVILPLIAGVIFTLVILMRRGARHKKNDLVKFGVIAGGFVAIAILAAAHMVLNGRI